MINKCRVPGCLTNHASGEKRTVFELPKDKNLQNKWLFFLNRDDSQTQKHVLICCEHFGNHFVKKNYHRDLFICSMNPFHTILLAPQSTTNVS